MNATNRMNAAIKLESVDRVPNAPFYEAPICNYFGSNFRASLLGGKDMAETHLKAVEHFKFDWVMVGMGLIGAIIPEALGARVSYPEDVFPIIEETVIKSPADVTGIAKADVFTDKIENFLKGVSLIRKGLNGEVPIACAYISPFTIATRLRGTNDIMTDIYEEPDLVRDLQALLIDIDIQIGKALIDVGVEYIFYGADMECPLLISPAHYRDFVAQPTSRVVNELARLGAKVLPHMCGQIVKSGIVDMLMEMDIHGIMPGNLTQHTVLDLTELKAKVGDSICIFDNLNPNGPLLIGTPEETEKETLAHLEKARSMRGYIFSTSGTTAPNTPRDNFEAMNQAVLTFV